MKKIIELIEKRKETEVVDFKLRFYSKECKFDLIKDMVSFANSCIEEDKYIIFGFDNKNNIFNNVDYDIIEDISNYVQLLNEYVEPFLDFTIDKFNYNNTDMACLCIKKTNVNRPYMIKKEFSKNGKIFLRRGEIYIRKNANNFIASRADLDAIYEAKKHIKINPENIFYKVVLKNGIERKNLWCLKIGLINNTNLNLSINSGKLLIKTKTSNVAVDILYIENYSESYSSSIKKVEDAPCIISSFTQLSKALVFEMSEKFEQIIAHNLRLNDNPNIQVVLTDLDGNNYTKSIELKAI